MTTTTARTATIDAEVRTTKRFNVAFDETTARVVVTTAKKGKTVLVLTDEIVDSGALVGHVAPGCVVIEVGADGAEPVDEITAALVRRGHLRPEGASWATWGGDRFRAARVLL